MSDGHLTDPPQVMTHISVVSRDTVMILLSVYVLNDIGIRFFDIGIAYLNEDTYDKLYFIGGK